ncbi:MAG TPA: YkvA family protein [Saprospiraceae bacterium]|nr:YkvA family protein [Saprospiraceae bacterium]
MEEKERFFTSIWHKLLKHGKAIGQKTVYSVLLMFYAFRRNGTPHFAKGIIIGTLGYFLSPFDAIPDLSPIIGYTDDLGVLSFGLVAIAAYINDEVRIKARKALHRLFKELDLESLKAVDNKL